MGLVLEDEDGVGVERGVDDVPVCGGEVCGVDIGGYCADGAAGVGGMGGGGYFDRGRDCHFERKVNCSFKVE